MRNVVIGLFCLLSGMVVSQAEIFSEDFESGIPASWILIDNDQRTVNTAVSEFQPAWITLTDIADENNTVAGSTSFFEPEGRASRWLITPQITLGDYGNMLYWRAASHDPSFPDWYMVLISTTGTEIADFTDTLFRIQNEFPYWTEREINMSDSGYNDVTVHLAFVNNTNRGFKLYLDDIRVEVEDPANIQELKQANFNLYPNPAESMVTLTSNEVIESVKIVDSAGKTVYDSDYDFSSIDVSNLENGLYFLQIKTKESFGTKRFIKR